MMTRSDEVDTIRGFALFGICVVNIPVLAQPMASLIVPQTGVDLVAQMALHTLFEGKFFVLFSFVFGWGFVIQMASAERAGVSGTRRFLRRLLGLLLIGVAHATLVFFGDILILYALLGLPLLWLRHAPPRRLLSIAAAAIVVAFAAYFCLALSVNDFAAASSGGDAGYRGGFIDAVRQRIRDWPVGFGFIILFNGPSAFAAFCVGLAAGKIQFFERGNAVYNALRTRIPTLVAVGLPLNILYALASNGFLGASLFAAVAFSGLALAGPVLGAVYLIAAVELARHGRSHHATSAAGRMSLTVYVLEGVLAGVVFNGYGFGLYGKVGTLGCLGIAVAVYATTYCVAAIWLQKFGQGPLETALRWITRGPAQLKGD